MTNPLLAREYELPKKPVFSLDERTMEFVRSFETVAFLSGNAGDCVMYGTNGNIGLRHHSQAETIAMRTEVVCNGVYHLAPVVRRLKSDALPTSREIGASLYVVDLNCLIDSEACTLSSHPQLRLSLKDGACRASCPDVLSADGGVLFDVDYTRAVSVTDLSLWSTQIKYSNFRVSPSEHSLSEGSLPCGSLGFASYATGDAFMRRSTDNIMDRGSTRSYSGMSTCSYKVEFLVTIRIDAEEWDILKADDQSEIWQRSKTSGIVVRTTTDSQCRVEYPSDAAKVAGDAEVITATVGADVVSEGMPYFSQVPNTSAHDRKESSHSPHAHSPGGQFSRGQNSLLFQTNSVKERKEYVIKKRFTIAVSDDSVPNSVIVTYRSRIHRGSAITTSVSPLFPSVNTIVEERRRALDKMWATNQFSIALEDDLTPKRSQMAMQYNVLRLASVAHNLSNGLPQSGCSASHEGMLCNLSHYLYFGTYYCYTSPMSALALTKSLYHMLPEARNNAHRMSLTAGALFPEQTITGKESRVTGILDCSRFYINSDIGFLISLFARTTPIIEQETRLWLLELMLETARVWPQLGEWLRDMTEFRLDNIAGPDAYNTGSSGNFYIHLCAKMHLQRAVDFFTDTEKCVDQEAITSVLQRILMTKDEIYFFRVVANAITVKHNDQLGVYTVHDNFDSFPEWTDERVRHPLHLHHHPLTIFQRKIVDVPEVLLGMLMFPELFDEGELQRNVDYYYPLATFDSPHSMCAFAIADARARHAQSQPIPFFRVLSSLDLDNITYTAEDGLNFCAMACSMLTIILGIGGVRISGGMLHVNPFLPAGAVSCCFTLAWHSAVIKVSINEEAFTYDLLVGESVRFVHKPTGLRIHLHTGYGRVEMRNRQSVPRLMARPANHFSAAVFLGESIFHNLYEYSYQSWLRVLEQFFESYRALHQRPIPPLNPEEFIEKVIYQTEGDGITFSGIKAVLASRNINVELGSPDDAEIVETRYGLANAKVAEMAEMMARVPPQIVPGILQLLRHLNRQGIALAIVSYSRNIKNFIANNPELGQLFVTSVDGEEAHDFHLRGQPHLDLYDRAAKKLHVDTRNCVVFSFNLDRNFQAADLARYRMFVNVENPFVSSRVDVWKYPELCETDTEDGRVGPVVRRMLLAHIPQTLDDLEDFIDGKALTGQAAPLRRWEVCAFRIAEIGGNNKTKGSREKE